MVAAELSGDSINVRNSSYCTSSCWIVVYVETSPTNSQSLQACQCCRTRARTPAPMKIWELSLLVVGTSAICILIHMITKTKILESQFARLVKILVPYDESFFAIPIKPRWQKERYTQNYSHFGSVNSIEFVSECCNIQVNQQFSPIRSLFLSRRLNCCSYSFHFYQVPSNDTCSYCHIPSCIKEIFFLFGYVCRELKRVTNGLYFLTIFT